MLSLFVGIAILGIIAIVVLNAGSLKRCHKAGSIHLLLEKTAALYEYAVYLAAIQLGLSLLSSFHSISNHGILTLDILYVFSLLMLIIYHNLKEPETSPIV